MSEYITREEFEQFKRHMEQKTDEIKTVRVEVASEDVASQLKAINEKLDQQSKRFDHTDGLLTSHSRSISTLQTTMATKDHIDKRFDAIKNLQEQILDRLPPK